MVNKVEPASTDDKNEYEKFGLYPYKTLQDIVAELEVGEYRDRAGHTLENSTAFQSLKKMAFIPPVPDAITATVAGTIHHLQNVGYRDANGNRLRNNPIFIALKQMNIQKRFRLQSEDGLRLLDHLEGPSFWARSEIETKELKDDPAFHDLRKIIELEGSIEFNHD